MRGVRVWKKGGGVEWCFRASDFFVVYGGVERGDKESERERCIKVIVRGGWSRTGLPLIGSLTSHCQWHPPPPPVPQERGEGQVEPSQSRGQASRSLHLAIILHHTEESAFHRTAAYVLFGRWVRRFFYYFFAGRDSQ